MNTGSIRRERETEVPGWRHTCTENARLLDAFGRAVQELMRLHEQQFQAIVAGDTTANRFDLLIHEASERKQSAKYAYMAHVEKHGCAGL